MSSKNRFFSILALAIGIAAFSAIGFAQDKTTTTTPDKVDRAGKRDGRALRPGKFGRDGMGARMAQGKHHGFDGIRGVDLTDAQRAQIRTIRENNKPDEATIKELQAIHEARKAGTPITAEQKERVKTIREQGRAKAESVHQQILGVLTADQKAQIEKRKQEMKQRMEEFRKNRTDRVVRTPRTTTPEKPKKDN